MQINWPANEHKNQASTIVQEFRAVYQANIFSQTQNPAPVLWTSDAEVYLQHLKQLSLLIINA